MTLPNSLMSALEILEFVMVAIPDHGLPDPINPDPPEKTPTRPDPVTGRARAKTFTWTPKITRPNPKISTPKKNQVETKNSLHSPCLSPHASARRSAPPARVLHRAHPHPRLLNSSPPTPPRVALPPPVVAHQATTTSGVFLTLSPSRALRCRPPLRTSWAVPAPSGRPSSIW
jgi:hypothetical protein